METVVSQRVHHLGFLKKIILRKIAENFYEISKKKPSVCSLK